MKKINIIILMFLGILLSNKSYTQLLNPCTNSIATMEEATPLPSGDWVKVFEDEFEDSELDLVKWFPRIAYPASTNGSGCNETEVPQCFVDSAMSLNNGILYITFKEEDEPFMCDNHQSGQWEKTHTSGKIWSNPNFLFGKFEAKIWLPCGGGLFPAFWLWTDESGEIDIMEANSPTRPYMTLHNPVGDDDNVCRWEPNPSIDYAQDWHIFKAIWDPFWIEFYIDNSCVYKMWKYRNLLTGDHLDRQHYVAGKAVRKMDAFPEGYDDESIILNLGASKNSASYPKFDWLRVDWIRAYQRSDNLCRDISISVIDNSTVEGRTITIGGGTNNFSAGDNIVLRAKEEIVINNGFDLPTGATLELIIDPYTCEQ